MDAWLHELRPITLMTLENILGRLYITIDLLKIRQLGYGQIKTRGQVEPETVTEKAQQEAKAQTGRG